MASVIESDIITLYRIVIMQLKIRGCIKITFSKNVMIL